MADAVVAAVVVEGVAVVGGAFVALHLALSVFAWVRYARNICDVGPVALGLAALVAETLVDTNGYSRCTQMAPPELADDRPAPNTETHAQTRDRARIYSARFGYCVCHSAVAEPYHYSPGRLLNKSPKSAKRFLFPRNHTVWIILCVDKTRNYLTTLREIRNIIAFGAARPPRTFCVCVLRSRILCSACDVLVFRYL